MRIFDGILEAASRFRDFRLPEVFCGYPRSDAENEPVRYPVACSPQAWVAGSRIRSGQLTVRVSDALPPPSAFSLPAVRRRAA